MCKRELQAIQDQLCERSSCLKYPDNPDEIPVFSNTMVFGQRFPARKTALNRRAPAIHDCLYVCGESQIEAL
jgi:hypothetical protein